MKITRRNFLSTAATVTLGFGGLHTLMARTARAVPPTDKLGLGYGELVKDANGILDLPKGFSYKIISKQGDTMRDGFFVPGLADGMAAFRGPNGKTLIVRNHEIDSTKPEIGAFGADNHLLDRLPANKAYDLGNGKTPSYGGTTTLLYNTEKQELEYEYLSLACTNRNCAGGPTPWNSWVTCEETMQLADENHEVDHGYNFEVPATAKPTLFDPVPLKDMGRFNHEAIAVDNASGIVYQTEDRGDGCLYRYIPNYKGQLARGGKLQALVVTDAKSLDTRNWEKPESIKTGDKMRASWIDVEDVEAREDDMRYVMTEQGAAVFARGEGMWTGEDGIYFACTNGGHAERGQIWRYVPSEGEGKAGAEGTLELFVEPNDPGLIDNADNLTIAPWGDIFVCEDGDGEQFVVGISPEGEIYKFAKNAANESEFAGACFSPDGSTLFVNVQKTGLTLAITGPWTAEV